MKMKIKFLHIFFLLSVLCIILLISLLPFAVSGNLIDPTQTAKTFFFLYGVTAIVSFYALNQLFEKYSQGTRITDFDLLLSVLFGYILVNRYLLLDVTSFSFRFYEFLGLALLYVILRLISVKMIPWFIIAVAVGGLLQALYGNLQLYGVFPSWHAGFKLTGSFFNPGPYAGYLVSALPVAMGICLFRCRLGLEFEEESKSLFKRNLLIGISLVAAITILLVLPATQSRAALLAASVGAGYLMYRRYGGAKFLSNHLNTLAKKGIAFSAAAVILVGGMAVIYSLKKDSANGRILIWKVTSQMIQEQPVIGLGFDRFQAGYMNAQAVYFQNNPEDPAIVLAADINYAFNELLQFTAEQGVIGLVLLILFGVLIVRTTYKTNSIWLIISKAGILSIVVFGLFSYPAQILPIKLNLILFLAIIASFANPVQVSLFSIPEKIKLWLKGGVLVFVLAGAIFSTLHLNELRNAAKTWKLGLDLYNSGNWEQAVVAYEQITPIFERNGDFLMNFGKSLSMTGEHEKAIQILHDSENHINNTIIQTALGDSYIVLNRFEEAEEAYLLASWMLPDRFYPQYLLVKLYETSGQWNKAIPLAERLLSKEPKIESTAVSEIKLEMERILHEYQQIGFDLQIE